jgi:hypothetical protein
MSSTLDTRPGTAPDPATPVPGVGAIIGLSFIPVIGHYFALRLALRRADQARACGHKSAKYFVAFVMGFLSWIIVFALGGVFLLAALNASHASLVPTSLPSTTTSVPSYQAGTGYRYASQSDPFDQSPCPDKLPPQVYYAPLVKIDQQFVVKSEVQILADAMATRNVACVALLGGDKANLNFAAFGSATVTVDSVTILPIDNGAYPAVVVYHTSDGSYRPFTGGGVKTNRETFFLTQTNVRNRQIWDIL